MRIALTGATGFVGKALLPLLLKNGHEVAALIRKPSVSMDPRVRIVQGDLLDRDALQKLVTSADVVLHVAGVVSAVTRNDFFEPNVDGALALAEAARRNGIKKFIFVSSLAAREPKLNFYCESKAAAENALQNFVHDFELTILRPSAVYGPGDIATLPLLKSLMSAIAFIPGSPTARFGMVHVNDLAEILAEAVVSNRAGLFEVDDGSGGHSWPELSAVTRSAFARPIRLIYIPRPIAMGLGFIGDMVAKLRGRPSLLASGQLRQIYHTNWCVVQQRWTSNDMTLLAQGLPDTIRWYQEQGLLPIHKAADNRTRSQDTTP